MPKAEGGRDPQAPAWLYLAKTERPPLSLRDISPRFAGGERIRLVQSFPSALTPRPATRRYPPTRLLDP